MGNWVKNRRLESGSTSVVMPSGSSATRPDAPTVGQYRFNTDLALIEFFNGIVFIPIAVGGGISYTVDSFVGDNSTTVFTMSQTESSAQQVIVFVGSIYQIPDVDYSVDGGFDITFVEAPPNGVTAINVIHTTS
jgi:hypothetical protein